MEVLRKAGLLAVIGVSVGAIGCSFGEPQTSELEGERVRETANAAVDAAGETAQGALLLERQAYIEQLTTIGYPANEYNCPIKADDPCAMVNILVELPRPTELMSVGHTGIAISRLDRDPDPGVDDLYYDFGPGEELTPGQGYSFDLGLYRKYHGRPWWDHPKHFDKASAGEVGFKDIVDDLDNLAGDHTVMRIPICVGKEHAKRIVSFWENEIYKDPMPVYSVPGTHCTSTVARSFQHTHPDNRLNIPWVEDSRTMSPTRYPERIMSKGLTTDYRHQCGAMKGELPRAILLRKWSGLPE